MRVRPVLTVLLALMAMTACASITSPAATPVTYIVVRHAEKSSDDPREPSLNAIGQARADDVRRGPPPLPA